MIDWLAELDDKENTLEAPIQSTDKTDRSCDVSVLSVHDQAVLKEKMQNPELIARISKACADIDMTPEQFIRVLNSKGKEQIISGELSDSTLKDYAKQIDDAINNGVVSLIMERISIS